MKTLRFLAAGALFSAVCGTLLASAILTVIWLFEPDRQVSWFEVLFLSLYYVAWLGVPSGITLGPLGAWLLLKSRFVRQSRLSAVKAGAIIGLIVSGWLPIAILIWSIWLGGRLTIEAWRTLGIIMFVSCAVGASFAWLMQPRLLRMFHPDPNPSPRDAS